MTEKQKELCHYRLAQAEETLQSSKLCLENHFYKDALNRSYYAAFYGIKAVLALADIDFKRHKDVIAYFNQHYVASGIFESSVGKRLARLQKKRENGDYDDFFIVSREEAEEQFQSAEAVLKAVRQYLDESLHEKF